MKQLLVGLFLMCTCTSILSEEVFVTDELKLQLRESQDSSSATIARLSSGDRLKLLEKGDSVSKVQTEDGRTGWVKSWFLTDLPPAAMQLEEANAELEEANAELEKVKQQLENIQNTSSSNLEPIQPLQQSDREKRIQQLEKLIDQRDETIKIIQNETNRLKFKKSVRENYKLSTLFYIAGGILLFGFGLGFWFAYFKESRRQRKRLNGFRISI